MPEFVTAVNANGKKQRVPAHWLGHPTLGKGFKLTPKAKAAQAAEAETPDESWKVPELRQYAEDRGVDLTGATRKADVIAAIESA